MASRRDQPSSTKVWALARGQHGVVSRDQLLGCGLHPAAIKHRVASGRLHPVRRGIYAVGRPGLTRFAEMMVAVLACGEGAALSHGAAAELLGIAARAEVLEVTVPQRRKPRVAGVIVHRRRIGPTALGEVRGIPVTSPTCTLVDLARDQPRVRVERAIDEADRLDLIDPETLRRELDGFAGQPGAPALRTIVDRRTFTLTDSALERLFQPLAAAALPQPLTRQDVCGLRVDFYWPYLGLVVETDGLRYHRTAAQQARDRRRDQVLAAAGIVVLRFTHAQVRWEPDHVVTTLRSVAARLAHRAA